PDRPGHRHSRRWRGRPLHQAPALSFHGQESLSFSFEPRMIKRLLTQYAHHRCRAQDKCGYRDGAVESRTTSRGGGSSTRIRDGGSPRIRRCTSSKARRPSSYHGIVTAVRGGHEFAAVHESWRATTEDRKSVV